MSISSSVQFIGAQRVMKAFGARGVPSWAIFCNKQFMFKYEGVDISEAETVLSDTLDMLAGSKATYTLNVYEDLHKSAKIKSTTPYDGSFNFQLVDKAALGYVDGGQGDLLREFREVTSELKERLAELEADKDEEKIEGNIIGMVKEVMTIPGVSELAGAVIGRLFAPAQAPSGQLGRVGAIDVESVKTDAMNTDDIDSEFDELEDCYNELRVTFPGCLQLLQRLRDMSRNDKKQFESIKAMILTFLK